jgi:uncharacterized protein YcbK (DUF882 family)
MSASRGRTGRLSAHFTADELACPHCGACVVREPLVALLERIRAHLGQPLQIVSGYRCPTHNAKVGGASDSMHMYGAAADVPAVGRLTLLDAFKLGAVGAGTKNGIVVHVDVRDGPRAHWTY